MRYANIRPDHAPMGRSLYLRSPSSASAVRRLWKHYTANPLTFLQAPRQKRQEFPINSRQGNLVTKLESLRLIRFGMIEVTQAHNSRFVKGRKVLC
jgi:hypothetical protein